MTGIFEVVDALTEVDAAIKKLKIMADVFDEYYVTSNASIKRISEDTTGYVYMYDLLTDCIEALKKRFGEASDLADEVLAAQRKSPAAARKPQQGNAEKSIDSVPQKAVNVNA